MATPQYIKDAQNAYNAKFDLVQLKLPKGTKERIKAVLERRQSIASYCAESVLVALERLETDKKKKVYLSGADKSLIQTAHKPEINLKTAKSDKTTNETEKPEIGANTALHQDEKTEEADSSKNNPVKAGFDGLKACEWNREKHSGVVPHPPMGTPKNAIWDSCAGEWYEPLPF